jgi:transketolase
MSKSTRQAFGESLARLGEQYPEIVTLDADLAKSTKSEIFAKKFPERFFEMGISEANMIGAAAGLSLQLRLFSHRPLRHHSLERRLLASQRPPRRHARRRRNR